ncbi:hypothetical protein Tsubulata_048962 [Turnera subulata]|uniref:DUF4216 domain-containing protein n=1 Tax=Turnera subulata TaxID=218843 RepID=A0A9Q0JAV6_9ROSI|nr:hypothetical protein Tsubulata_048962 [Turnera subulata]
MIHTGEHEDHDPYIEASQARMVYYVEDETDKGWSVAVHVKPRDVYEMGEVEDVDMYENESYQEQDLSQFFDINYENVHLAIEGNDDDDENENMSE